MTEQTELRKCPFCGEQPETSGVMMAAWVGCRCGVEMAGDFADSFEDIAAAWNRRADDAELAAVRRALNGYAESNLASLAEVMMSQRRLLAEGMMYNQRPTEYWEAYKKAVVLAHSIVNDEPAFDDDCKHERTTFRYSELAYICDRCGEHALERLSTALFADEPPAASGGDSELERAAIAMSRILLNGVRGEYHDIAAEIEKMHAYVQLRKGAITEPAPAGDDERDAVGAARDLQYLALLREVTEALKFAMSVIKSGERWSAKCDEVIYGAMERAKELARKLQEASGE